MSNILDGRRFTGLKLSSPRPGPSERAQDVGGLNTGLKMGIDVRRQNFRPTVLPLEGNRDEDLNGIAFLAQAAASWDLVVVSSRTRLPTP